MDRLEKRMKKEVNEGKQGPSPGVVKEILDVEGGGGG